ncbi:MAG: RHS repeat-associated core domain-containing protein, partial [Clostridiales bacterium]|nr:RHS repeat-associated core domain-containing protein [Clostridiales bacterium]
MSETNTTANTEFVSSEEKRFAEKEFNLVGGVTAEFDLVDKTTSFSFTDVAPEDSVMGIGISHTYKKSAEDFNVGQNFRLNVNEKFVKDSTGTYIYTDDKGDKHKFIKYHYKKENGNKVYVDVAESDVTVETDGSLTYEGQEIFAEYRSALGLKAVTELDDYKNFALYEERSDELKQLEEQVNSYKVNLDEYVVVKKEDCSIQMKLEEKLSSNEDFEEFINTANKEENIVLTAGEQTQYQTLKRQYFGYNKVYSGDAYTTQHYYIEDMLANTTTSKEEVKTMLKDCIERLTTTGVDKSALKDRIDSNDVIPSSVYEGLFITENSYLMATNQYITGAQIRQYFRRRNLLVSQEQKQQEDKSTYIVVTQNQIAILEEKKSNYVEQIERYYKEYYNKSKELEKAKRDLPENFLSDGKIARAYSVDGRLVAVYDKYENYAVLEYDRFNQNRLNRIVDNNNKEVKFEYNTDGKLISITDAKGRKSTFGYNETGELTTVILTSGELAFGYTNGVLIDDKAQKLSSLLTFDEQQRITEIKTYSYIASVSKGVDQEGENTTVAGVISDITLTYGTHATYGEYVETCNKGIKERYYINNNQLSLYLKEENSLVVDAEEYSFTPYYVNGVKQENPTEIIKKASKTSLYWFAFDDYYFEAGEQRISALNQFNNPTTTTVSGIVMDANGSVKTITTYYEYDDEQRVIKEDIYESCSGNAFVTHKTYNYNEKGELVKTETFVDGEEFTNGKDIEERVYDKFGNQIKSFRYNSLDASSKFYTESIYDEKGTLTAELDSTGENKTEYNINENTSEVLEEKLPNGSKFAYGYDKEGRVTAISQSTEEGEENSTQKTYSYGELVEVKSANTTANYTYDGKRRVTKIGLNGNANYIQKTYTDDTTLNGVTVDKVVITNAKGETITKYNDKSGKVMQVEKPQNVKLIYTYDQRGRIASITEKQRTRTVRTLTYQYDDLDRLTYYAETDGTETKITESLVYNSEESVNVTRDTSAYHDLGTEYDNYLYSNDSKKRLTQIETMWLTSDPKYDMLGRNKGRVISGLVEGKLASEKISYRKVGDHTTNMPSTIVFGERVDESTLIDKDKISYSYDKLGNIEKVYLNGALSIRYGYDKLGRLVREDNKPLNKTTVYHYDNNGNILRQKEYAFTFKNSLELEELPCTEKAYSYDGDKMLSFNGEACAYDLIGNPTTYRGKSATWSNGRNMTAFDGHTFTYDGLGRRATKDTLSFTYDRKGRLISQSNGLQFSYDHTGIFGFKIGYDRYFYRKDAQGNIIALIDINGTILARYIYDAWGNHKVVDNAGVEITDQTHVGNLNPFRYRGYYFDTETGLYFLKTRYYDPQVCRFITIDSIEYIDPETINGLNLYAYCGGNPVMNIDPTGHSWWSDFWSGVKARATYAWEEVKSFFENTFGFAL